MDDGKRVNRFRVSKAGFGTQGRLNADDLHCLVISTAAIVSVMPFSLASLSNLLVSL